MRKKKAKKLRKLAEAIGFNKSPEEVEKIYKRMKSLPNKKQK